MSDPFVLHRNLLFTVAYEMLGSAVDAEDVVQETWLRWSDVDQTEIDDPRAYLVQIVTRQSLNRLRTMSRRREEYVGEWLPEPVATDPDLADDLVLAESVSMAMLLVLETLGPTERAVFVLHEVFETPYSEIAAAVGKTEGATRQISHRARQHVAARRPRTHVDLAEQREVVDRFLTAVESGDVQSLLDVLAPDVVLVADGGGRAAAARQPLHGSQRVANFLSGLERAAPGATLGVTWINGTPAIRIDLEGTLDTAVTVTVEEGRISRIYAVRNPEKLTRLDETTLISRSDPG